jgi:hypothetical protein
MGLDSKLVGCQVTDEDCNKALVLHEVTNELLLAYSPVAL